MNTDPLGKLIRHWLIKLKKGRIRYAQMMQSWSRAGGKSLNIFSFPNDPDGLLAGVLLQRLGQKKLCGAKCRLWKLAITKYGVQREGKSVLVGSRISHVRAGVWIKPNWNQSIDSPLSLKPFTKNNAV